MTRDRYVLGIDTSGGDGSISLAVNGKAGAPEPLPPRGHSSALSEVAAKLLAAQGITWKDLTGVAVSEGPGSFTGLRIGLAWAKGLCLGSGIQLVLVPGHEALGPAVAERGDAKLLAGESADLIRSAPAYGREPNARKPAS